jgi:hypothetical protein
VKAGVANKPTVFVMAGLDPAIHHQKRMFVLEITSCKEKMDARVKPAHDESAGAADDR